MGNFVMKQPPLLKNDSEFSFQFSEEQVICGHKNFSIICIILTLFLPLHTLPYKTEFLNSESLSHNLANPKIS